MRKRNIPVLVCPDKKEFERLEKLSRKAGLSLSAVIRDLISGSKLIERPSRDYRTLVRAIDRIGANINQIAHMANITRSVGENEAHRLNPDFLSLQKEIETRKKLWL